MRITATVSNKELSSKAVTLIDIAASFNFVSKEFVMANGFYKDCKKERNPLQEGMWRTSGPQRVYSPMSRVRRGGVPGCVSTSSRTAMSM